MSLETRASLVTERADVVLPVSLIAERAGTFVDWEGRRRPFPAVLQSPNAMSDLRVLAALADAMGKPLGFRSPAAALAELDELGPWEGTRAPAPAFGAGQAAAGHGDQLVLASWRLHLDDSRALAGEPYLAATARPPVARVSPATAVGPRRPARRGRGDRRRRRARERPRRARAAPGRRARHGRRRRLGPGPRAGPRRRRAPRAAAGRPRHGDRRGQAAPLRRRRQAPRRKQRHPHDRARPHAVLRRPLVGRADQGPLRLRAAHGADAVHHRVRAQGRRPDAAPQGPDDERARSGRCSRWPTA